MARLVALDEVDPKLKQSIVSSLRVCDEATVLPQAHKSPESGTLKGVVMRLDGSIDGLDPEVFNPAWFSGVSVLPFPTDKAEMLLSSDIRRKTAMEKLAAAIPSEMKDSQTQVGPELDGGEEDRDVGKWECGFDSSGCCVGLYSALQNRAPDCHLKGMNRVHKSYYLVYSGCWHRFSDVPCASEFVFEVWQNTRRVSFRRRRSWGASAEAREHGCKAKPWTHP